MVSVCVSASFSFRMLLILFNRKDTIRSSFFNLKYESLSKIFTLNFLSTRWWNKTRHYKRHDRENVSTARQKMRFDLDWERACVCPNVSQCVRDSFERWAHQRDRLFQSDMSTIFVSTFFLLFCVRKDRMSVIRNNFFYLFLAIGIKRAFFAIVIFVIKIEWLEMRVKE